MAGYIFVKKKLIIFSPFKIWKIRKMSSPIGQLLSKALEILKKLEEQVAEKTPGKYLMNLQPVHKHYP